MNALILPWRNIWRNQRRTFITIGSVFFAVLFSVVMTSFSNGTWNRMIENMLRTQAGHIEIHQRGYWDDQVIDHFMTMDRDAIDSLSRIDHIANISPRVETFAMASSGNITKGIAIKGIDPVLEDRKSSLSQRLTQGAYLSSGDTGILIGQALSEYLKVTVGDTLALIGQGYHGASAAGLFPIRGIVSLVTPEMDKNFIYMTLPATQAFIDMPDGYSGMLIALDRSEYLATVMQAINASIDTSAYELLPWTVTMERLMQQAESDKAFTKLIMLILYMIVGFGILGTVIMMSNERRHEFGMMIALGMRRGKLAQSVGIELLTMTLIGTALSLAVTAPFILYFNRYPIQMTGQLADTMTAYGMEAVLPMDASPGIFISQGLIILSITSLTFLYPAGMISKLKVNHAIKE